MRNNYADNDAEAKFYRGATNDGADQTVEAAQEDQFWVVDWVTITGGSGTTVQIKFGADIQWSASVQSAGIEHFTFNPPLYSNGKTKNEALVVNGTGTDAIVCLRYR